MVRVKLVRYNEDGDIVETTVIQMMDGEKLILESGDKQLGELKIENDSDDNITDVDYYNYVHDFERGERAKKLGVTLGALACKYCGIVSHGLQHTNRCDMCGEPYLENVKYTIRRIRPL
jgi:predicted Zn-ribbon and HTH transcriptional regulator